MDAELREDWCKALESGNYEQGRESLRVTTSKGVAEYCCLGVFLEVAQKKGLIVVDWSSYLIIVPENMGQTMSVDDNYEYVATEFSLDEEKIPMVEELFGFSELEQDVLVNMNDGEVNGTGRSNFKEIAAHIREEM